MQCIDPKKEFQPQPTPPFYCKDTSSTGCKIFDNAINQAYANSNNETDNKIYAGNLNIAYSDCKEIFTDKTKITYKSNNIFEIKNLQSNWLNEAVKPLSGLSCKRSVYGGFDADGTQVGDVNTNWENIKKKCRTTITNTDQIKTFNTFYLSTNDASANTTINFTYNCTPVNATLYTKCNRPGWESPLPCPAATRPWSTCAPSPGP